VAAVAAAAAATASSTSSAFGPPGCSGGWSSQGCGGGSSSGDSRVGGVGGAGAFAANPWETLNGSLLLLVHLVRHTPQPGVLEQAHEAAVRFLCVTGFVQQLVSVLVHGLNGTVVASSFPTFDAPAAAAASAASAGGGSSGDNSSSKAVVLRVNGGLALPLVTSLSGGAKGAAGRRPPVAAVAMLAFSPQAGAAAANAPLASSSASPFPSYRLLAPHTAMTLLRRSVALLEALAAFPLQGEAGAAPVALNVAAPSPLPPSSHSSTKESGVSGGGIVADRAAKVGPLYATVAELKSSRVGSHGRAASAVKRVLFDETRCGLLVELLEIMTSLPPSVSSSVPPSVPPLVVRGSRDKSRSSSIGGGGVGVLPGEVLPDEVLDVTASALLALSHLAQLDLCSLQTVLGGREEEGEAREGGGGGGGEDSHTQTSFPLPLFLRAALRLTRSATATVKEEPMRELLTVLGYFALDHPANQALLLGGKPLTPPPPPRTVVASSPASFAAPPQLPASSTSFLAQLLRSLPSGLSVSETAVGGVEDFALQRALFPTLISVLHRCAPADVASALDNGAFDARRLGRYLQRHESAMKKECAARRQRPSRGTEAEGRAAAWVVLSARFPTSLWAAAIQRFLACPAPPPLEQSSPPPQWPHHHKEAALQGGVFEEITGDGDGDDGDTPPDNSTEVV